MTKALDLDKAGKLLQRLAEQQRMQGLTANDVIRIEIVLFADVGKYVYELLPSDAQWNGTLTAVKNLVDAKVTATKTQLTNLGVTELP